MDSLGNRIKNLREQHNIPQKELAKILNIGNSTLSQYESNLRIPSDDIKIKIANYFNVSVDYLIGNSNSTNIKNDDPYIDLNDFPEGVKILRRANKELSPEGKKKMIEMANLFIDSLKDKE